MGSERGDDLEFEPDEEDEEARSDPGDEERLKTRGGHTRPEPPVALPSSISPRLRDILARSRMTSREAGGDEGRAESPDPTLHVLKEDKYGEVVLERLAGEVGCRCSMSRRR